MQSLNSRQIVTVDLLSETSMKAIFSTALWSAQRAQPGTQGSCWSSTASQPFSSRLDLLVPLDQDWKGRESEADAAQVFLTLIQLTRKSSQHNPNTQVLWRWASGEAAGEDTLEAVATNLHTGDPGLVVVLYLDFCNRDEVRQPPG